VDYNDLRQRDDYQPHRDEYNLKQPLLEHKVTADFSLNKAGNQDRIHVVTKEPFFKKARDYENDSCDNMSIDEGVKASNAHESVLKSP
jgi:hypothetical protein